MKKEDNILVLKGIRYFLENPHSEVYLREYSRILEISPNTAQRFLELFLKEKLITDERKANLRYFKANTENIVYRQLKIALSMKEFNDAGIVKYLEKTGVISAVLYGSVAKGLDDKESDIDLLIISNKKNKLNFNECEKRLGREITSQEYTLGEWEKIKSSNKAYYQEVMSTGITLIGEKPL